MLSRLIRQTLFLLVHFTISVLVAVQNIYNRLRIKKRIVLHKEKIKSDVMMILEHAPKITKSLKHLVVLVNTDYHSTSDLARVVIWSLIFGVPYVSFYEISGELKLNEEKLFMDIEKNKKGIPGCIKWAKKPVLNGYSNGINSNTIIINIFSYKDGKPQIVECIKRIAKGDIKCKKKCEEFTSQEFGSMLSYTSPPVPDPDLVMYTGPLCCSYDFLPWQIRLTEFIQLSLDHSINIENYLHVLYTYNKCEQRFGK